MTDAVRGRNEPSSNTYVGAKNLPPKSLPNSSEVEIALNLFQSNERGAEDKWRSMCISSLSYGTDYDYSVPLTTALASQAPRCTLKVKVRAAKTLQFFVDFLLKYDKLRKDTTIKTAVSDDPKPRSILIDSLWLAGCLLSPNITSPQKGQPNEHPQNDSYDALQIIVQGLANNQSSDFTRQLQIYLDPSLLSACHLVVPDVFSRKMKKFTTNMIYRQKKFNLLVEESEGYAKLISFLLSSQQLITKEQNGTVHVYIRELMGAFDLDPNRVLDLILDMIDIYLDKALQTKQHGDHHSKCSVAHGNYQVLMILKDILKGFKKESLPQLLGFKLTSYRCDDEQTLGNIAQSFHLACAFLICHDLVKVQDLVPHLEPCIIEMENAYKEKRNEEINRIKKLGVISLNATPSTSPSLAADDTRIKEPQNSSVDANGGNERNRNTSVSNKNTEPFKNDVCCILHSLLSLEAWDTVYKTSHFFQRVNSNSAPKSALHVLSRACTISPSLGNAICQMIHKIIKPIYMCHTQNSSGFYEDIKKQIASIASKNKNNGVQNKKQDQDVKTSLGLADFVPSYIKVKCLTDLKDMVHTLYAPLMIIADSGCIRNDPILYCKLCRLFTEFQKLSDGGSVDYEMQHSNTNYEILQKFLIPSLSLFNSNPSLSSELWKVLQTLHYTTRYALYDAWGGPYLEKDALRTLSRQKSPKALVLIESEIKTGIECRYVLKRLSKDNIKDMGRKMAKASHSNPIVVFSAVMNQIEVYDNLIELMVDSFRFVTKLSLDIVGYCVLLSLRGGRGASSIERNTLKSNGMSTTKWLSSISQFTGSFYRKFPDVELHGLLSHLINELLNGRSSELSVLRHLLTTAGGYDFADCDNISSLSPTQLEGRAGGQLLKRETSSFGVVEKLNKKSSKRLREVLQHKDVGFPLLLFLSQVRIKIMHEVKEGKKQHLKLLGNLFDTCHSVFTLLLEFLTDPIDEESATTSSHNALAFYATIIPTLKELKIDFGLKPAIAWMLVRPLVRAAVMEETKFIDKNEDNEKEEGEAVSDKTNSGDIKSQSSHLIPAYLLPYLPAMPTLSTYEHMLPKQNWKYITPVLYEFFWSLSLYDVLCPKTRYECEISRLKKETDRLISLQNNFMSTRARDVPPPPFLPSDKVELERMRKCSENLSLELKMQKKHCKNIFSKFERTKADFFHQVDSSCSLAQCFLSTCVFPRCLLSPDDAIYCARFVEILHCIETPHFETFTYIDQLIRAIIGALWCVTEDEASNLGILLCYTWTTLSNWRYDESLYKREVLLKPGSIQSGANISISDFINVYNKWHVTVGSALLGCMKSKEYIHIRAAIVILSRVVDVYPTRPHIGERFFEALRLLKEDNSRPDIKTMANAYSGRLEKARKNGVWKEQDAAKTNKMIEDEQMKSKVKKEEAQRIFEQMKKENEQIERGQGRDRGGGRHNRWKVNPPSTLNPQAPVFTPPNGGPSVQLYPPIRDPRDMQGPSTEVAPATGRHGQYRDHRDAPRRSNDSEIRNRDRINAPGVIVNSISNGGGVNDGLRGERLPPNRWQRNLATPSIPPPQSSNMVAPSDNLNRGRSPPPHNVDRDNATKPDINPGSRHGVNVNRWDASRRNQDSDPRQRLRGTTGGTINTGTGVINNDNVRSERPPRDMRNSQPQPRRQQRVGNNAVGVDGSGNLLSSLGHNMKRARSPPRESTDREHLKRLRLPMRGDPRDPSLGGGRLEFRNVSPGRGNASPSANAFGRTNRRRPSSPDPGLARSDRRSMGSQRR